MAIDGNLEYSKSALGNYLTTRKKNLQYIITAAFDADDDIALTDENTGAVVLVPTTTDDSTITLPTAAAGLNYKLVCGAASGAHTITIAGTFAGSAIDAGIVAPLVGSTSIVIADSDFIKGDYLELVCDGTTWFASGLFVTADAVTAS